MKEPSFELKVVPAREGDYGLAVYQRPQPANGSAPEPVRLIELWGPPLRAVADLVLLALRQSGYRATDLSRARREPFRMEEAVGVRLALLFLAVKPLRKHNRIEAVSAALRSMPTEEAYYWFSKCTASFSARQAQRALRIMLAEE